MKECNYKQEVTARYDVPVSVFMLLWELKESSYKSQNGLNYIPKPNGVVIIPDDLSYRRFISNSMYDNNGSRA